MEPLKFEAIADKADYLNMRKSLFFMNKNRMKWSLYRKHPVGAYTAVTLLYLVLAALLLFFKSQGRNVVFEGSGAVFTVLLVAVLAVLVLLLLVWLGYGALLLDGAKLYKAAQAGNDTVNDVLVSDEGLGTTSRNGSSALFFR